MVPVCGAFLLSSNKLGDQFVGHSDLIAVGAQIRLIRLVGLILIWSTLTGRARSKLPLVVASALVLFNGALEHGTTLAVGLLLAASPEVGEAELDGGRKPHWPSPLGGLPER